MCRHVSPRRQNVMFNDHAPTSVAITLNHVSKLCVRYIEYFLKYNDTMSLYIMLIVIVTVTNTLQVVIIVVITAGLSIG